MTKIIGRLAEQKVLDSLLNSKEAEFLAVYGRRRVGKTFLIRNMYAKEIIFQMTGIASGSTKQQLTNFYNSLQDADERFSHDRVPGNWMEAFDKIKGIVEKKRENKKVIFFDEMPWIDTARSDFMQALEHFWNAWASARTDIILVVCGSAASWMISKLINNKGGLHNRVTKRIKLMPFTLAETEKYLKHKNVGLDRYQIMQLYMAMGGIPFYLNEIIPGRSAAQEIDRLCFSDGGMLVNEYENLYKSLFGNPDRHIDIVEALAKKNKGLSRDELIKNTYLPNGGNTTKAIAELVESGFITQTHPFKNKVKTRLYRLTDPYSLFYLKFIKDSKAAGEGSWVSRIDNPSWRAWSGYAYENICFMHIDEIKVALGISGVYSEISSWQSREGKAQIDLLIDRRDHVISICEGKYSMNTYPITKSYRSELENKISAFRSDTQTRKTIFLVMITTFGLEENKYSVGFVHNSVKMDDLFG